MRRFRDFCYATAAPSKVKKAALQRFEKYVKPGEAAMQKKKQSQGQKAAKNAKWAASRQQHFNQQIADCVNFIVDSVVYNVSSNIFDF